jgi:host factor-I protein
VTDGGEDPVEMDNPLNIQNTFFNQARKDRCRVTVYLTSGIKLVGRIKSFDKFTVILESSNGDQMIFKHAISTVSAQRQFGNFMQMEKGKGADATAQKPEVPEASAAAADGGSAESAES